MKIYLAGSCAGEDRTIMMKTAEYIKRHFKECEVYTPFTLKIENAWSYSQEAWSYLVFEKDITALRESDIVIYISKGRISSSGSNFEQGYAFALQKKIFVLQIADTPTSLMTYCGCYNFYNVAPEDIEGAIKFIAQNWERDNLHKHSCRTVLT